MNIKNLIVVLAENEVVIRFNSDFELEDLFLILVYFLNKQELKISFVISLENNLILRRKKIKEGSLKNLTMESLVCILEGYDAAGFYSDIPIQGEIIGLELRFEISTKI